MADTITELEKLLEEAKLDIFNGILSARRAKGNVSNVAALFASLGTKWSGLKTEIDNLAAAEPDNAMAQQLQADMDQAVEDFNLWSTITEDAKTAVDPIIPDRQTAVG